jgi:hypothetical protein
MGALAVVSPQERPEVDRRVAVSPLGNREEAKEEADGVIIPPFPGYRGWRR